MGLSEKRFTLFFLSMGEKHKIERKLRKVFLWEKNLEKKGPSKRKREKEKEKELYSKKRALKNKREKERISKRDREREREIEREWEKFKGLRTKLQALVKWMESEHCRIFLEFIRN